MKYLLDTHSFYLGCNGLQLSKNAQEVVSDMNNVCLLVYFLLGDVDKVFNQ